MESNSRNFNQALYTISPFCCTRDAEARNGDKRDGEIAIYAVKRERGRRATVSLAKIVFFTKRAPRGKTNERNRSELISVLCARALTVADAHGFWKEL